MLKHRKLSKCQCVAAHLQRGFMNSKKGALKGAWTRAGGGSVKCGQRHSEVTSHICDIWQQDIVDLAAAWEDAAAAT